MKSKGIYVHQVRVIHSPIKFLSKSARSLPDCELKINVLKLGTTYRATQSIDEILSNRMMKAHIHEVIENFAPFPEASANSISASLKR